MDVVRNDIIKLVEKELGNANEEFPLFRNEHEASAVIREELEECEDGLYLARLRFNNYWTMVKENQEIVDSYLDTLKHAAINTAVEAIQVAAMCDKEKMSRKAMNIGNVNARNNHRNQQ